MSGAWTHLVRFLAEEDGQEHLGQVDAKRWPDVGLALEKGEKITVNLVQGSVFDGVVTEKTMTIAQVRGPKPYMPSGLAMGMIKGRNIC